MAENVLAKIPIFANLPEPDLAAISAHASTRKFAKNVVIINEGNRAYGLYLILSGKVKVFLSERISRPAAI